MEPSTAFQICRTAIEFLNKAREAVKGLRDRTKSAEIAEKLNDVHGLIANLQSAVADLELENHRLKLDLQKAVDLTALKKSLPYSEGEGVCWEYNEDRERIAGPFCANCLDIDGKKVHLNPLDVPGAYFCSVHKRRFYTKDYRAPEPQPRVTPRPWFDPHRRGE